MSPDPPPEPDLELESAEQVQELRARPIRVYHDAHVANCPSCRTVVWFTDSPSMRATAESWGHDPPFLLVDPVEATFQGVLQKIWPVKCISCGRLFIVRLWDSHREFRDHFMRERAPYTDPLTLKNADLQKKLAPKPIDQACSVDVFVTEVAAERNQMVKTAIIRKFQSRNPPINLPWR